MAFRGAVRGDGEPVNITRSDIEKTVKCGDGIAVEYLDGNVVGRVLRWAEGGKASHFIECLGGLDTVEETIGGGMATRLDTYLKGNCNLTIKRVRGALDLREEDVVRRCWNTLVGKGYGWDSIKRTMVTMPIRRFIKPRAPRLARWLTAAARWALPGQMPDCSAAWVDGIRLVRPHVLTGYDACEVDPELLRRDKDLVTVAYWPAATLVD